jgi:hypothetical protein
MTDTIPSLDDLKTGDVILFSDTTNWASRIIEYFTGSKWSHVGIVLRDPIYIDPKLTGLYLWESGPEDMNDAEDNVQKWGVQIVDLRAKIKEYNGTISGRKITNINKLPLDTKERDAKIQVIFNTTYDKPYDYNPLDMIFCLLKLQYMNSRSLNSVFCSAFASYIYTELGYLDKSTNWSMIEPCHFSSEYTPMIDKSDNDNDWQVVSESGGLKFVNGFTLEAEIKIK